MKQVLFFLALFITISSYSFTQDSEIDNEDIFLSQRKEKLTPEFKAISKRMYIDEDYKAAKIDNLTKRYRLRYNIFKDQMEFTVSGKLFFLKKDVGRVVNFTKENKKYKVFDVDGKSKFFVLHNNGKGKGSVLTKLVVKFQEAQQAESTFQQDTPADFKRTKDQTYITLDNVKAVKLPSKKKGFYALFGDKSSAIKAYMKKNKLGRKKIEDLQKVMSHYNTL